MGVAHTDLALARCDAKGRLLEAGEPLAGLQLRCGGEIPGTIAIPALLELVDKAGQYGLKLARPIRAIDDRDVVTAWVEIAPLDDGTMTISVTSWMAAPAPPEDAAMMTGHRIAIDRALAELTARLDARQNVLSVEASAPDLAELASEMAIGQGRPWTDFVTIEGSTHRQPMHWRLLDGATLAIAGSQRRWRASLIPSEVAGQEPVGFELCLTADSPLLPTPVPRRSDEGSRLPRNEPSMMSREVAPVLRQPITRIIANAETIRTRMAGPLADQYSQCAADIAAAGKHLLSLVEDLADLEVVEAESFDTAPDRIDLADVARQAAGILAVRARERGITLDAPRHGEQLPAIAEFRRVLQIMLNLVSNAIRYSPEGSQVWIRLEEERGRARVIVADQGPGVSDEEQGRIFDKFERLGRSSEDGGTGLGLYISRRLARAMSGDILIESAPGKGARFILELPADPLGAAHHS